MQFNYISNEEVSYQNFDLFFGGGALRLIFSLNSSVRKIYHLHYICQSTSLGYCFLLQFFFIRILAFALTNLVKHRELPQGNG